MNATKTLKDATRTKGRVWTYVISIAIALGVGGLSALLTMGNMDLYSDIRQPPLAPPAILFPIVWTVLYVLMGVSAAMVLTDGRLKEGERSSAMIPYAASLFVNFFWSIIFFNMKSFLFALVWLLLLIYLVVKTVRCYAKVSPLAAYLQIPYIAWLIFAAYLNAAIYLIN